MSGGREGETLVNHVRHLAGRAPPRAAGGKSRGRNGAFDGRLSPLDSAVNKQGRRSGGPRRPMAATPARATRHKRNFVGAAASSSASDGRGACRESATGTNQHSQHLVQ